MKNDLPVYLYSLVITLEGIFLLFSKFWTFETIKYSLGLVLILGAIFGFLKYLFRISNQVEFSYHELHAVTMLIYGFSVLLFASSVETLVYFSTLLLLFYSFSEIIFCTLLFNLGKKVIYKIFFIRIFLGLLVGGLTITIMQYHDGNKAVLFQGYGLLFMMIGLNLMLYVPVMKVKKIQAHFDANY